MSSALLAIVLWCGTPVNREYTPGGRHGFEVSPEDIQGCRKRLLKCMADDHTSHGTDVSLNKCLLKEVNL